jgi:hypothetical protein
MKTETLEEFMARGGKVTKVPPPEVTLKPEAVKSTSAGGPAILMTLGEADLYYGEHKKRKVKAKPKQTLDVSALPPELRKKYVDDIIDGNKEEKDEEE